MEIRKKELQLEKPCCLELYIRDDIFEGLHLQKYCEGE